MDYKICNNCGEKSPANANFCSNCKSTSFRPADSKVPMVNPNQSSLIYSLFYWPYDGGYVLSKSKVASIGTFVILFLSAFVSPYPSGVILVGIIAAALIFLVGFLIHKIKGQPSKAKIEYNDYGFLTDIRNLLFFWQNKNTGEFVVSKTKIISFVIFIVLLIASLMLIFNPAVSIIVSAFFTAPAFIIGVIVHKLTNNNPTNGQIQTRQKPKKVPQQAKIEKKTPPIEKQPKQTIEKSPEPAISQFDVYSSRLKELKSVYAKKEADARRIIEKKFSPPQITYTRFIGVVDKSTSVFNATSEEIENIISLASEDTPRIDAEIRSKFGILNSIIDKMDDLINELVISLDSTDDEDVGELIGDMEDLIGSIKDYE